MAAAEKVSEEGLDGIKRVAAILLKGRPEMEALRQDVYAVADAMKSRDRSALHEAALGLKFDGQFAFGCEDWLTARSHVRSPQRVFAQRVFYMAVDSQM